MESIHRKTPGVGNELHPVGDAAHCVRTLGTSLRRTGVSHVLMLVEASGTPEGTYTNIARIGAEVLPALRASSPDSRRRRRE